ncbi:hypothetical protein ACTFIW_010467, partial [Dictyostelium discoideum]|jgi:2-Cys peroxiredoxin 5
VN